MRLDKSTVGCWRSERCCMCCFFQYIDPNVIYRWIFAYLLYISAYICNTLHSRVSGSLIRVFGEMGPSKDRP